MSDSNWAPPSGPPISARKLDPKLLGLGGGLVAALVVGIVVAASGGDGGGDGSSGSGSGRQYMEGTPRLELLGEAPSEEPARQWEYASEDGTVSEVVLTDEAVVIAVSGRDGSCTIRALDLDDADERWSIKLVEEASTCGELVRSGDQLIATYQQADDIEVVALTASKGDETGRSTVRNASAINSRLLVDPDGEHAYVVALNGRDDPARFVQIDVADSRRSWAVEGDYLVPGQDGLLVSNPDRIEFVDYETGDTLWDREASDELRTALPGGPQIFVAGTGGLTVFDSEGNQAWSNSQLYPFYGSVETLGGVLLVDRIDSVVVDEQGTVIAQGKLASTDLVATVGERLIVQGARELTLVSRDGEEFAVERTHRYRGNIVPSRNALLLTDGSLVALDPESFEPLWELGEDLNVRAVANKSLVTVDGEKVTFWK